MVERAATRLVLPLSTWPRTPTFMLNRDLNAISLGEETESDDLRNDDQSILNKIANAWAISTIATIRIIYMYFKRHKFEFQDGNFVISRERAQLPLTSSRIHFVSNL